MFQKRGRPLSGESGDTKVDRRRRLERERQQRYRDRQRRANAARAQVSSAQLEQSENIINLPSVEEEEAAATLLALGVRSSADLQLPQDPLDAQLQQRAEVVNEHQALYTERQREEDGGIQRHTRPIGGLFREFTTAAARRSPARSARSQSSPPKTPPAHAYSSTFQSEQEQIPISRPRTPAWSIDDNNVGVNTGEIGDIGIGTATEPEERASSGSEADGVEVGPRATEVQVEVEPRVDRNDGNNGVDSVDGDNDDAASQVNFEPELEVDEEREAAYEHVAAKLFDQIQGGHHGCSEEAHAEKRRQHMAGEGGNHFALRDIFKDRRFPSVLGLEGMLTPASLTDQRMPIAAQWEEMFGGVPARGQQRLPKNVCLHEEQTQEVEPQVAYDIDSFLGFALSLAMALQGLLYQPAPQMQQNIHTDVHLETDSFEARDGDDETMRARKRMLRDVPHCLLGRVYGAASISVYVLFPYLPLAAGHDRFVSMTQHQLTRWTDQVFLPAVWRFYPTYYTQHLPATYEHAFADSKARQVEGRKIETGSYQAQQSIAYHLRPEFLQQVWASVLGTVGGTPGLQDFREPQLFFAAKGTKISFQNLSSRPTWLDVMERFESYVAEAIDMHFVDQERFYVDVGKEICAGVSLLPGQQQRRGDEAQVYSWKRCCLEKYMRWMYDGRPPAAKAQGQRYYHQNMLYDASSLTSVTPKKSTLRKGGLIYSQFYGSVKEITDASKCKPFDNDALEEMALDPQLRRGVRNIAGGHRRDVQIVERAYAASKRRARAAILGSKRRSFGIREEHRITWALFQRLKALLEAEDRPGLEVVMTDCPAYAWPVKTEVYLDFLWRSADKFATGFEVVRARARTEMIPWEQTKIMIAFLRCLRYVMGGHQLEPESALWWSKRTLNELPRQRVWYGLGFCNTLPRYKYCWLEPRIDWEQLRFKTAITDRVLFGNNALKGQVLRRGAQVRGFFDTALALERGLEWLSLGGGQEVIRNQVVSWMVHLCLKQFRIDVLSAVKAEIREEHREDALQGERPFCYEYFEEIMTDGCYLMSGNRCDYKVPSDLVEYLLGRRDNRSREHWDDKPFRKLYQRAREALGLRERMLKVEFTRQYRKRLYEYHWVLPYPCGNALLQTSKGGRQRMWYSIGYEPEEERWVWARKGWVGGRPADLPRYVGWTEDQWKGWIEERGGATADDE